jgi:hypothetical protein
MDWLEILQVVEDNLEILEKANGILPYLILGSTIRLFKKGSKRAKKRR